MEKDLERKYLESQKENQRLATLIEDLQRQLKLALDGNAELCTLLKSLQVKLDELIAQTKKRNKREYGKKTEKHNPRPAATQPKPKSSNPDSPNAKSKGAKHILDNAEKLPHEPVHHSVKPEQTICPTCTVETEFVSKLCTQQLEMVSACLKILDHKQETRACPKCKLYIVTAEKPCPPIPGSYAGPRLLGEIIVGNLMMVFQTIVNKRFLLAIT
jgi:hypothetical protein